MNDIRILVTGVGAIVASSILRSYKEVRERNIYIVGVDIKNIVKNKYIDAYYQYKRPTDEKYIETLIDICIKENVDFIVPLVDSELMVLSENREIFNKNNITLCLNDKEKIRLVQNKSELYRYLKDNNIEVPKYVLFNNVDGFLKGCNELNYPKETICFKPINSSGSRGFHIIKNDLDYEKYLFKEKPDSKYINYEFLINAMKKCQQIPNMMLMEYVPGDLFNVNVLADNGKIIYIIAGKVINFALGNTLECEIVESEEITNYCSKIVELLKLSGNIGFEVAYSKDGTLKLIEINIRIQGQIYSSTLAGINFPYYELKYYLKEELPSITNINLIRMVRYFEDECM